MRTQIVSLAVLALLASSTNALQNIEQLKDVSLVQTKRVSPEDLSADEENIEIDSYNQQMQKEDLGMESGMNAEEMREEINEKEASPQNKQLFANINSKLQDQSFVEMATQKGYTHTEDYEDFESRSNDLFKGDFGGRNTDSMTPAKKDYEDHINQGQYNSGGTNEIKNQPQHTIPGSWDKYGPTNVPKHMNQGDYQHADGTATSSVVQVYLTVDSDEHATRLVKALFNQNLIAQADQIEGKTERTYLKLGRMATEKGRDSLELTTTSDKVAALIDYINQHNPTTYDYPVPNTVAVPVNPGNAEFIAWVHSTLAEGPGLHESTDDM